jgi:hypothetical protein
MRPVASPASAISNKLATLPVQSPSAVAVSPSDVFSQDIAPASAADVAAAAFRATLGTATDVLGTAKKPAPGVVNPPNPPLGVLDRGLFAGLRQIVTATPSTTDQAFYQAPWFYVMDGTSWTAYNLQNNNLVIWPQNAPQPRSIPLGPLPSPDQIQDILLSEAGPVGEQINVVKGALRAAVGATEINWDSVSVGDDGSFQVGSDGWRMSI